MVGSLERADTADFDRPAVTGMIDNFTAAYERRRSVAGVPSPLERDVAPL
jgi:hypothetical protein